MAHTSIIVGKGAAQILRTQLIRFCYAQLNPLRWSGSVLIRLPVAAKIALQSAGKVGGSVGSPRPVGA
jgi:hypothetical protein